MNSYRTASLAVLAVVAATPALAGESVRFADPAPVDFTKPFIFDPLTPPPQLNSAPSSLPVTVISTEDVERLGYSANMDLTRLLAEPQAGAQKSADGVAQDDK